MTIDATDVSYVRALAREHAAIIIDENKEYLIEARLRPVAEKAGATDISDLVSSLRSAKQPHLRDLVIDALTTNETSWFRDRHPFDALHQHILPRLIEARRSTRSLSIWCAAASTGQEPYSLALTIREHFPELAGWRVRIVATDISRSALEQARSGSYSQLEINRGMPAALIGRYFKRDGARFRIVEDLRNMVEFRELNLVRDWIGVPSCDVVLIRNVMIYFEPATKSMILDRLASKVLRPDAALMLGAAETTLNLSDAYVRVREGPHFWYQLKGKS